MPSLIRIGCRVSAKIGPFHQDDQNPSKKSRKHYYGTYAQIPTDLGLSSGMTLKKAQLTRATFLSMKGYHQQKQPLPSIKLHQPTQESNKAAKEVLLHFFHQLIHHQREYPPEILKIDQIQEFFNHQTFLKCNQRKMSTDTLQTLLLMTKTSVKIQMMMKMKIFLIPTY